ncbi:MAG: PH domain-containing protein [Anaerolineales bacterium]
MVFQPDRRAGIASSLIILLVILSIQALVLIDIFGQRLGPGQYLTAVLFLLTLPVLALWAYWFYQLCTLSYLLSRDALTIRCGWFERVVPLRLVERCVEGSEVAADAHLHGVSWPGFVRGHMHLRGLGRVRVYSTAPLGQQLIVVCNRAAEGDLADEELDLTVSISPRDQELFLKTLQARRDMGPLHNVEPGLVWRGVAAWPVWRDRLFWTLALSALVLGVALYGLLALRYRALPTRLPLHFGRDQLADRIGLKQELLIVPAIGSLVTLVNGVLAIVVHRHERLAALLLSSGSLGIVALSWVALVGLIY